MKPPSRVVVVHAGRGQVVREVARIRDADPDARIVVTGALDTPTALDCIEAGCHALVSGAGEAPVRDALAAVQAGHATCPPDVAHALFVRLAELARAERWRAAADSLNLSLRQVEILRLVAGGLTTRQIAEHLFVSKGTVKNHLRAALRTLGLASRHHAAELASERGWFEIVGDHVH